MSTRKAIDNLRQELERLTIASVKLRNAIATLERQEQQVHRHPNLPANIGKATSAQDHYGTYIKVSNKISFLTEGRFRSTEGIVTRFLRNKERVFAINSDQREIPQAPRNVAVPSN